MASEHYINSYRDLAVNAIEDLKNYANDEGPERLMVSYRGYTEDLERLDNTTPVAPVSPDATGKCGELVTVGYGSPGSLQMVMDGELDHAGITGLSSGVFTEPVCFRSQAVELLADAQTKSNYWAGQCGELYSKVETLKADNSALTARVKELEKFRENAMESIRLDNEYFDKSQAQIKALKAKLAAAERALTIWDELPDNTGSAGLMAAWFIKAGTIVREARAALGGKP